ncbi:MAG: 16S rRNA (guanine(966)-N(2))-methyltransferase RsmD [Clostridia bacterium]|nr:16S rRNA (guanine(966)-N(2))-methyltransferase RsmD [Clostridia bacterium]
MLRIIAGSARGRRFEAPEGRDTRPTLDRVRENLFNMLQGKTLDARTLDLFAGSGALSLEALSRGAAFAVLADRDREAIRVEKKNIAALGFEEKTRVLQSEWKNTLRALSAEGEKFDLIFLDPPYVMTDLREVTERLLPLMAEESWIVIEHQAKAQVQVAEGLGLVKERTWGYCGVKIYEQLRDSGFL